jgi:hypothetical protein
VSNGARHGHSWVIAGAGGIALALGSMAAIHTAATHSRTLGLDRGATGRGFPGAGAFPGNGSLLPRPGDGSAGALPVPGLANGPAAAGSGGRPGIFGSITSVTVNGFTLAEIGGTTIEVVTNAATQVTTLDPNSPGGPGAPSGRTVAVTDLTAGQHVAVVGDQTSGSVLAQLILIIPD